MSFSKEDSVRPRSLSLAALLAVVLPAGLRAQDTATARAPLEIHTSEESVARRLRDGFGLTGALPELHAGEHWLVTLDATDHPVIRAASGEAGWLRLEVHPAALMQSLAEVIARVRPIGRGFLTMSFIDAGCPPGKAVSAADQILDFPKQVSRLAVDVTGDALHGFHGTLRIEPAADTGLAGVVAGLRPAELGPPMLPLSGGNLSVRVSIDPEALREKWAPVLRLLAFLRNPSTEVTQQHVQVLERWMAASDGTSAVSGTFFPGITTTLVAGLRDPQAAHEIAEDPSYLEWTRKMAELDPRAEMRMTPHAWTYRGVAVDHSVLTRPSRVSPNAPDEVHGEQALVGSWSMGVSGRVSGVGFVRMRRLIDAALDGKIARTALPKDTLADVDFDFGPMVQSIATKQGKQAPDLPVHRLTATLSVDGGALVIAADVR